MNEDTLYVVDILAEILDKIESQGVDLKDVHGEVEGLKQSRIRIESKIDNIGEELAELIVGFGNLKEEVRDSEEKINLMNLKLNRLEGTIDKSELEDYYALSQSNYCNWDMLEDLTRKFIPVAEYLFSKLQKFSGADYSPVIIELCRAIENELLIKVFKKYSINLINKKGKDIYKFLLDDEKNYDTKIFLKAIKKAIRSRNPEFTLGQMKNILSLLLKEVIVRNSPLLQDFGDYISNEYKSGQLLNVNYIDNIRKIVEDYRNPSAHPEYMDLSKAKECKKIMPDRIDYLLDCMLA